MFIALRDLAYAKGRFLLIGPVVAPVSPFSFQDPDLLSLVDPAVRIADGRLQEIEVHHAAH